MADPREESIRLSEAPAGLDPLVERVQRELLGGPLDLDRRDVSRTVGVSLRTAERFWHALGFPGNEDGEAVFSQLDLTALRGVAALVRRGELDEESALSLTRAFARTADRLSVWQCSVFAESLSPWAQGEVDLGRVAVSDESHDSTRAEPDEDTALAAARMGCQTLLLTHNIETLGQMSCNPSIGGIGKGHLVKEVDALGGAMALATDVAGIQFRILNGSKGPAVRATRAQADRILYKAAIRETLENQPNLQIFQQAVDDLMVEGDRVVGAVTADDVLGAVFSRFCIGK